MNIKVRGYEEKDLSAMIRIWNEVVEDGVAFPQEEVLTTETGREFFAAQTYSAVAEDVETGEIYGLYIRIRTMSDDAVISVMQAMQFRRAAEGFISEKN